jgi:integrase
MGKLYNQEIKEKFLETYENEQSRKTINNVFLKSELIESVLDKDLYNFNQTEIGKVISNANPHSKMVARSLGRFISQYISWAMPYRESNLNPLQGADQGWYDKFVDKTKKIHHSFEEFLELLEDPNMLNAQDQAFLFCLFEGLSGKQFSEIREITIEDINWDNNEIYIKERDQIIQVSPECIKYLDKAVKQDTYYVYHSNTKEFKEKELLESKYIFKNVKAGRNYPYTQVSMTTLYNRLNSIKDIFGIEYFTGNSLRQSGMIWESIKLYKEYGKLDYEQFEIIGKKYNFSLLTNNGYTYYNTFLMKQFISPETIKDLYDIDIEF